MSVPVYLLIGFCSGVIFIYAFKLLIFSMDYSFLHNKDRVLEEFYEGLKTIYNYEIVLLVVATLIGYVAFFIAVVCFVFSLIATFEAFHGFSNLLSKKAFTFIIKEEKDE